MMTSPIARPFLLPLVIRPSLSMKTERPAPVFLEGLCNGFASACYTAIRVFVIRSTVSYFHRRIPPKGKLQWRM
jgi:hypothetical protein